MNDFLAEAIAILNDLENDLQKCQQVWLHIDRDNPGFDPNAEQNWLKKQARCWLHGATHMLESNELERWLFDQPPPSDLANTNARKCVEHWREWLEIENAYYEPFYHFEFEDSTEQETLKTFLLRMAKKIEEEGEGARLAWRAFKSFIAYARKIPQESAFIEQIFPLKSSIQVGSHQILRKIPPEAYPLPEELAGAVLMELAKQCRESRPDAQLTAAESLGLCWLCLSASRLRLPVHLKNILLTEPSSIYLDEQLTTLSIPTLFGPRQARISQRVGKFLHALSLIPSSQPRTTILQRPRRSLTRALDEAITSVKPDPKFGNITYMSLLILPHHFGNHRYQPN